MMNLRACQQTPEVEDAPVYLEADVDAIFDIVLCLSDHHAEENGEQSRREDTSFLKPI